MSHFDDCSASALGDTAKSVLLWRNVADPSTETGTVIAMRLMPRKRDGCRNNVLLAPPSLS